MATDSHGSTRITKVRGDTCDPWLAFGGEMDFQVNGETYFLSLAEDERRWLVFVSTDRGARAVPVYEDVPEFKNFAVVIDDKGKPRIPN